MSEVFKSGKLRLWVIDALQRVGGLPLHKFTGVIGRVLKG